MLIDWSTSFNLTLKKIKNEMVQSFLFKKYMHSNNALGPR